MTVEDQGFIDVLSVLTREFIFYLDYIIISPRARQEIIAANNDCESLHLIRQVEFLVMCIYGSYLQWIVFTISLNTVWSMVTVCLSHCSSFYRHAQLFVQVLVSGVAWVPDWIPVVPEGSYGQPDLHNVHSCLLIWWGA